MKHYGDITKINGAEIPLVDIVTGGSPCQDLSVAGKRAGLDGERSGLFMEQVRVFKEMRDECESQLRVRGANDDVRYIRPRFFVWENVPGAFSSNRGEDFRCVLEEVCRIADKTATVPMPEKGKWSTSGCIMGDGWSVAWRVHDAQFWGVAQRRRRVSLVADFGGQTAPEILFESKSVSGNIKTSREQGQEVTRNAIPNADETISFQERAGKPGGGKGILIQHERTGALSTLNNQSVLSTKCLNSWDVQNKHIQPQDGIAECLYSGEKSWGGGQSYVMQGINGDVAGTLDANYYKGCGERQGTEREVVCYGISAYESNAMKSSNPNSGIYEAETTRTLDLNGGNPACNQGGMIVLEGNGSRESHKGDGYKESETMYTLNTVEQHAICVGNGQLNQISMDEKTNTLDTMHDQQAVMVLGIDRASFNQGQNAQFDFSVQEELAQTLVAKGPGGGIDETVGALCARDYKGVGNQYVNEGKCIVQSI